MPVAHAVYDPNARNSKWYVDRLMADPTLKATVEIKAQRNYPVSTLGADGKPIVQTKVQKSTIKLAPKAANVGKSLFKRTPVGAITQALIGLGIGAVDWVLDPENNTVNYKDPNAPTVGVPAPEYTYRNPYRPTVKVFDTWFAACNDSESLYNLGKDSYILSNTNNLCQYYSTNNARVITVDITAVKDPDYDPDAPPPVPSDSYIYLPIDDVAQKIIDQASAGDPVAQQVLSDAALDMLEAGLLDAQLEAAADAKIFNDGESDPIDPNAPNTPVDPDAPNPDAKPFELPPFCSWASKVCEWADWTMEDAEPPPDTPLPEKDIQMADPSAFDKSYVSVEEECPADIDASIPVGPTSFSLVIPITPICYFGSTYVSPVLQFMAYIFVALGISRSLRVG